MLKQLSLVFLIVLLSLLVEAQEPEYLHFPLSGHPVKVVDLHPSDKLYPFLSQLQSLKLVLLEPGIKKSKTVSGEKTLWFTARCFIIQGRSENFSRRKIIEIMAGKFE